MTEQSDAFAGQGGSYLLDPQTGERTLIERTQMSAAAQQEQPEQIPAAPANPETTPLE